MRKPAWVKKSGPYRCRWSLANGNLVLEPAWLQYGKPWTAEQGGGPGFLGRMELADDLEQ